MVAVRGPGGVNLSVDLQQAGPLFILFRIKDDVSAGAVVAGSGIGCRDRLRASEELLARS